MMDDTTKAQSTGEPTPEQAAPEQPKAPDDSAILAALDNPSDAVKAKLDALVSDAVKKALADATPKAAPMSANVITQADFDGMTYEQRLELYNANRPLYDRMTKGD